MAVVRFFRASILLWCFGCVTCAEGVYDRVLVDQGNLATGAADSSVRPSESEVVASQSDGTTSEPSATDSGDSLESLGSESVETSEPTTTGSREPVSTVEDTEGKTTESESTAPDSNPSGSESESATATATDIETSAKGGVIVGSAPWYLANEVLQSCDEICEPRGGYSDATKTFAGSGGSNDNCDAVLTALGVKTTMQPVSNAVPGGGGIGCAYMTELVMRVRDEVETTAGGTNSMALRACACNE